jgi:O-antigen/teichoic acid export membrane protein
VNRAVRAGQRDGRLWRLFGLIRAPTITGNLAARVAALAALTASSLLVARTGGPAALGTLALLRVLPWFVGLLLSFGLYGAAPYFLSPGRNEPGYRATLPAMATVAGVAGAALWLAASPLLGSRVLPELSAPLMLAAGIMVPTQLLETSAKTCSQGFDDLSGSNRIIVLEELLFVPIYGLLAIAGTAPYLAMVVALPLGDILNGGSGWIRLWRRGYFRGTGQPSLRLARNIAAYGVRAELNSITLLLNGRLDFIIVTVLVGPAALGIYAVASRVAEMLRLPSLAINYVLYPAFARQDRRAAAAKARAAIRRTWWIPASLAVAVAAVAPVALPLVYGRAFREAVVPAWILLAGLSGGAVYGVLSAFLSGVGRPGLTSIAQAVGLMVTVTLDLTLIPQLGIVGAATASTFAYLTTTCVLIICFRLTRAGSPPRHARGCGSRAAPNAHGAKDAAEDGSAPAPRAGPAGLERSAPPKTAPARLTTEATPR